MTCSQLVIVVGVAAGLPEVNARPWLAWPRAGRDCSPAHLAGDRFWCASIAASTPWLARHRCSNRESILRPLATNSRPCEGCQWCAKNIRFRTASGTPLQRGWGLGYGHPEAAATRPSLRYWLSGIHPRHTATHVGRVGWLRRFAGSIRACHKRTRPNHGVHASTVACQKKSCARLQARRRGRPAR